MPGAQGDAHGASAFVRGLFPAPLARAAPFPLDRALRAGGLSRLRAVPPPGSELEGYEGRLEFWDGRTQTAWKVCEPTSTFHEVPSRMLPQVAREFAHLRGSPIKCYGSADLWIPARSDAPRRLMQADEMLYLHPGRSQPHGSAIEAGTDPLPDVVLEVDHTTDASSMLTC